MATLSKNTFHSILLNDKTDTSQLLGCFEQTGMDISRLISGIEDLLTNKL